MAKTQRLVTVTAGRLQRILIYTQAHAKDEPKARAAKSRISSAARMRINARTSWEKLEELLAANFEPSDLFVTLTYREAPPTREYAQRQLNKFLTILRAQRRIRGAQLLYIKNCEHVRDDESEGRWHHHLVINATGADFDEIRSLWSAWGDNVDFETLGTDYEARAKYLCKERAPAGRQTWTPSRGLRRPDRHSELVDDSAMIVDYIPAGAVVLSKQIDANEWGSFSYIKCLLPSRMRRPDKRRKRSDAGG